MKSKATLTEIAEKAGVSIATVSRILNETGRVSAATRQKVYNAIRGSSRRTGKTFRTPTFRIKKPRFAKGFPNAKRGHIFYSSIRV